MRVIEIVIFIQKGPDIWQFDENIYSHLSYNTKSGQPLQVPY